MNAVEQEIIRHFFRRDRQERLLFELSSPKKRPEFYWHLAGTREMKDACLDPIPSTDSRTLKQICIQSGAGRTVYCIGSAMIGQTDLDTAVRHAEQGGMCILYFGNGLGYYQGEPDPIRRRFLLRSK